MAHSNERNEAMMATNWNLNRKSEEGGAKINECITERKSTYKGGCTSETTNNCLGCALAKESEKSAQKETQECMVFLLCSPLTPTNMTIRYRTRLH